MKKLLSILTISLLTSSISNSVISCDYKNNNNGKSKTDSKVIKQIKAENNFVWNDNTITLKNNEIDLNENLAYYKYTPNWLYLLTAMQISQEDQKNIASITSNNGNSLIDGQKEMINFKFKKNLNHPDYNQSTTIAITWNDKTPTIKDLHYLEVKDFVQIDANDIFNISGIYYNMIKNLEDWFFKNSNLSFSPDVKYMSISKLLTKPDSNNIVNIDYKYNNKQYEIPMNVYWEVASKPMNNKKISFISTEDDYTIVSDGKSVWTGSNYIDNKWTEWSWKLSKNIEIKNIINNYIETNNGIYQIDKDGDASQIKVDKDLIINKIYQDSAYNYYATNKGLYFSPIFSSWTKIKTIPNENITAIGNQNNYLYVATSNAIYQEEDINTDAFKKILILPNNLQINNIISDYLDYTYIKSNYFETNDGLYQLNYQNDKYTLELDSAIEYGAINYFSKGLFSINNNIYNIEKNNKIIKINNNLSISAIKSMGWNDNYIIANNNLYIIINNKLNIISVFKNDNFTGLSNVYFIDNNKVVINRM